jgi:hypothetical protein
LFVSFWELGAKVGVETEQKTLLSAPRNSQPFPRYVLRRGGFEGLDTLFSLISHHTSHWLFVRAAGHNANGCEFGDARLTYFVLLNFFYPHVQTASSRPPHPHANSDDNVSAWHELGHEACMRTRLPVPMACMI